MGVEQSPSAFNLHCSAREMTEVVKQAGNRFCFLLSHPGKENGKLPLSLSVGTRVTQRGQQSLGCATSWQDPWAILCGGRSVLIVSVRLFCVFSWQITQCWSLMRF